MLLLVFGRILMVQGMVVGQEGLGVIVIVPLMVCIAVPVIAVAAFVRAAVADYLSVLNVR